MKNSASELWQLLSKIVEEEVKQSNVRSILERKALSGIYNNHGSQIVGYINSPINICGEKYHDLDSNKEDVTPLEPFIDLTEAPELTYFYNRVSECSLLKQWMIEEKARLVTLYGLSGIGKSAIALKVIEEIKTDFDYIIWQNLTPETTLSELKIKLKQFFWRSQTTTFSQVMEYLRAFRCLIVLDDVQNIFQKGQLAGEYLTESQDYSGFFKQIARTSHQSCLLLISKEKPRELSMLEREGRSTHALPLKGLDSQAEELLRQHRLEDQEYWSELIELYQGHPSWLNIISSTILELFGGRVSLFLKNQNPVFLGDLEPMLQSDLDRLSPLEKKVIFWMADQEEAMDVAQDYDDNAFSRSELWQSVQSLVRRGLVEEEIQEAKVIFKANPIFKPYINVR